jgi:hypothetical protein
MKTRISEAVEQGRLLALRSLFVAAGAEYNDGVTDKTKTAPWGETVIHKAGHYYLNGLGDITEGEMTKIYNRGYFNENDIAAFGNSGVGIANNIRTNLCRTGMWNTTINKYVCFSNNKMEVLNLHVVVNPSTDVSTINVTQTESLFSNAVNLRIILPACVLATETWHSKCFAGCYRLEEVRIIRLRSNISFVDSALLSKNSILYVIQNTTATSAITITLHPDAYARLVDDAEIVAALEAQPLVSLVSA